MEILMAPKNHVPSLSHLRDFARARAAGRPTHVAQDWAQVNAPADERFFGFAYERFLTSTITYVQNRRRSDDLDRAHEAAPARMSASYQAAARGVSQILEDMQAVAARRRQRNVVVTDPETGESLVSLRLHLMLEPARGMTVATHFYFPAQALAPAEQAVMETAVALAVEQAEPACVPGVALARNGTLVIIRNDALLADRVDLLRSVSGDYQNEWQTQG